MGYLPERWKTIVELIYITYISVDLVDYEIYRTPDRNFRCFTDVRYFFLAYPCIHDRVVHMLYHPYQLQHEIAHDVQGLH